MSNYTFTLSYVSNGVTYSQQVNPRYNNELTKTYSEIEGSKGKLVTLDGKLTFVEDDFDYIVVSPETYPVALKINRIRQEKGKKPLEIVYVEYVVAEDGIPISSTRISEGEIDRHGRLKAMTEKKAKS